MRSSSSVGLFTGLAVAMMAMAVVFSFGLQAFENKELSPEQAEEVKQQLQSSNLLDIFLGKTSSSPRASDLDGEEVVVPLTRRGRSFFVNVEINEYREATLLVDTGASETALTPDIAYDLGLVDEDTPEMTYNTANGQVTSFVTTVESIRLGDAIQYNIPVSISKEKQLTGFGDGLLGMSFFERYIVYMDSGRGELHLRPRDS